VIVLPPQPCALVIRHGLTFWNAEHRWQGRADIDLHPDGIAQAHQAARALTGLRVHRVVASNLTRAFQTAKILSSTLHADLPTIEQDPRLAERDIGEWSGKITDEIEAQWPGRLEAWRRGQADIPGGEPDDELTARVMAGLRSALESVIGQKHPVAVVVSHGGVMRALDRITSATERTVHNLDGRWFSLVDGAVVAGDVVRLADRQEEEGGSLDGTAL
jgi:broad specificity phosphatase PhoE